MRKPFVAGNWKMNTDFASAQELFNSIDTQLGELIDSVDVMVAPPSIYISSLAGKGDKKLSIGAQDCSANKSQGAYTGEYSAEMLKSVGVEYAILGHSERRAYHGEDDSLVGQKIEACIAAGIVPVYCCGEQLHERESGNHVEVVKKQITTALLNFEESELKTLVVAYEPVWAIGTGKTASAEQAQEMHAEIRSVLVGMYSSEMATKTRILYGGSCKPSNSDSIFSQPDVDGGLIGGAALKADDFLAIIRSAAK